jgi:hypothetical protein
MIENYFVMLVTHLKSLVGNIVGNATQFSKLKQTNKQNNVLRDLT